MVIILFGGLVLTALAVTLLVRSGSMRRAHTVDNLSDISHYGFTRTTAEPERTGPLTSLIDSMAARFGDFLTNRLHLIEEQELRHRLVGAGFYSITPRKFTGYRILTTLFAVVFWFVMSGGYSLPLVLAGYIVAPVAGWMGPLWVVKSRARRRLEQIEYDLPELIDLLVVTIEAGVGFAASLQIAAERLEGPVGDELKLVLQEQSMGLSITEALKNMLARCETPAVRGFVRSMLQGEQLGVSIGQIMRNLALEMRKRRRAAAEERAQKAPIKILFPLVFLIFPAIFVVLLGPAVYSFMNAFGG